MTAAKHTPGPWEVEPPNEESPDRFAIVASTAPHWCIAETVPHITGEPDRANARLMAAAPDMLAALERLMKSVPMAAEIPAPNVNAVEYDDREWAELCVATSDAMAAIARARGE